MLLTSWLMLWELLKAKCLPHSAVFQLSCGYLYSAGIIIEWEKGLLFIEIERTFQSWRFLIKFSYVPITSKVTAFVLAIHSSPVHTRHQILVVAIRLDPLEH